MRSGAPSRIVIAQRARIQEYTHEATSTVGIDGRFTSNIPRNSGRVDFM